MRTVPVNAERSYQVEIGINWQVALTDWIEGRNKVVLIKSEKLNLQTDYLTIEIPDGEAGKSPEVLLATWQKLGDLGINRQDLIIGIGDGHNKCFSTLSLESCKKWFCKDRYLYHLLTENNLVEINGTTFYDYNASVDFFIQNKNE